MIRELQGLKGVGRVERMGGVKREIQVRLDPDRLMALGITASQVNAQIRNTSVDLSGGKGEVGGQNQAIRTLAAAKSVDDLADTRIALGDGREVRLSELGTVEDRWEEPKSYAGSTAGPSSPSPSIAPKVPPTPRSPTSSAPRWTSSGRPIPTSR